MSKKKSIVMSLIFAVIIFGVSYLTCKEANDTIVSLGDAFVMLAACFLPTGWAMLAALIGCGAYAYIVGGWQALIAIVLFRVLAACWFMDDEEKLFTSRTVIGVVMSFVLFTCGPFLFNMLVTETFSGLPIISVSALGAFCNVVLFFGLAFLVDKFKIKDRLK